jgi:hypothetical protein
MLFMTLKISAITLAECTVSLEAPKAGPRPHNKARLKQPSMSAMRENENERIDERTGRLIWRQQAAGLENTLNESLWTSLAVAGKRRYLVATSNLD